MHTPLLNELLGNLRCAERQQQSLRNWSVAQALAGAPQSPRQARGLAPLLRRLALRAAWRLTRLAGSDSGPYTMKERAILVDAQGMTRTVCPEEIYVVLLPRADRDAA
ncbi:MAG: hypothetical protein ACR2JW_17155 [Thermomicrobiales bacterium]